MGGMDRYRPTNPIAMAQHDSVWFGPSLTSWFIIEKVGKAEDPRLLSSIYPFIAHGSGHNTMMPDSLRERIDKPLIFAAFDGR